MVFLAWAVNKLIFNHLVNQEPIILFMATIGLAYFMEGFGDIMWGADIKKLDVGLPQGINLAIDETTYGWFGYGFFIDNLDIVATVIALGRTRMTAPSMMAASRSATRFSLPSSA